MTALTTPASEPEVAATDRPRKVTDYIAEADKTLFSFEILPPKKGRSIETIFEGIEPLMEFKPPFINVTYHREEVIYKEQANGMMERIKCRKRPGTIGICSSIKNRYGVDAVPHVICGDFTWHEIEDTLIELNFLGLHNILALRGDPVKNDPNPTLNQKGPQHATDLIEMASNLNKGIYLDDDVDDPFPTDFCIGAAGYPEKHFESPNMDNDMAYLKRKVDLGAEFITTQMFFDNKKYFKFVDDCRKAGINVPIIPGIKPLTTKKHLNILPKIFHLDMPDILVKEVEKAKTKEAVKQVGVEWCTAQVKELVERGAPSIHFYTMSRSASTFAVAKEIF